jgi:hypothetical protein
MPLDTSDDKQSYTKYSAHIKRTACFIDHTEIWKYLVSNTVNQLKYVFSCISFLLYDKIIKLCYTQLDKFKLPHQHGLYFSLIFHMKICYDYIFV